MNGNLDYEEKKFEFQASINDIIFHIWSRKATDFTEEDVETYAHMHYHSEFHYIYEGSEKITLSDTGEVTEIHAGEFCCIPSNVYHTVSAENNVQRECFFLDMEYNDTEEHREHSDYYLFSHILSHRKNVTVHRDSFVSSSMEHFHRLTEENESRLDLQRGLLLINAIVKTLESSYLNTSEHVINKSRSKSNALRYNRKRIIEEFISSSYMNSGGLAELAKILYLSERQAHNVVKNLLGEDFKTLIVRQRINTANALIKTTNLTLDEISREVGYNSYSGFYMAYVRLMGISPESVRGENE